MDFYHLPSVFLGIESLELSIGGQINPQPVLSMYDDFGHIKHALLARHGSEPLYLLIRSDRRRQNPRRLCYLRAHFVSSFI